ncbi:MAG: hypothetical protein PHQ82_06665 [Bacteroidales bacterium]|nr:hypothetical protein [Bacteroidales bacterium]
MKRIFYAKNRGGSTASFSFILRSANFLPTDFPGLSWIISPHGRAIVSVVGVPYVLFIWIYSLNLRNS